VLIPPHSLNSQLISEGTVVILQEDLPFTPTDWETLNSILDNLSYENITQIDASEEISVKLYWVKQSGANEIHNHQIMDIINSPEIKANLLRILGCDNYIIDQCLCNLFQVGDVISKHIDNENCQEHKYVFMVCLNDKFEGGEFCVYHPQNTTPYIYKPGPNSLILTKCDLAHEFKTVTKGSRRAIVTYLKLPLNSKAQHPKLVFLETDLS
jgi:hypothetical protein